MELFRYPDVERTETVLSPVEQVARDAELEGRHDAAFEIRLRDGRIVEVSADGWNDVNQMIYNTAMRGLRASKIPRSKADEINEVSPIACTHAELLYRELVHSVFCLEPECRSCGWLKPWTSWLDRVARRIEFGERRHEPLWDTLVRVTEQQGDRE